MEYKLNPWPIFEDCYIKGNQINIHNKHQLKKDKVVYYQTKKENLPYFDHIETSNIFSSLILSYGADIKRNFVHSFHIVFPTFRRKVNDTRGSFACRIKNPIDIINNNRKINEKLKSVTLDGSIKIDTLSKNLKINRKIIIPKFPGMAILYAITNKSKQKQNLKIICPTNYIQCDNNDYFDKPYHLELSIFKNNNTKLNKELNKILKPNETFIFYLSIRCLYNDEIVNNTNKLVANALLNRTLYNIKMDQCCFLKLGNLELETMYYFSKIHSVEAIFLTKNGYMHSPCGGQYYAATWTNDQCEYAFPFFSYLPYNLVTKTMINCFKQYEKYMYTDKPLVSSIIAEATSFWNGANDRGDSAMYAYGLTRFLLTYGQKSLAKAFIKPLKWCLDYTLNKTNQDGVIESDTDELENRFESGKANLATNAIFYQALVKANILFNELNIKNNYDVLANNLKENINKYFYKEQKCLYCKEEKNQRTHIVYPLIMGIYDHKDDIINTLLNNNLYTDFGFKVSDNEDVYWDRITLMAIRGLFNADEADLAYKILEKYTNNRLLNDHVPYAIEAYPEGNQAHLAAESALYARIFIEGMLGFEPYGFKKFKLHLSLPNKIKKLYLKNFLYNKHLLSIYITRNKDIIKIKIPELNLNKQISNHQDFIINI